MSRQTRYHDQKIWPIAKVIRGILKKDQDVMEDEDYFRACLYSSIPQLSEKKICANCGASMLEYVYTFSFQHAIIVKLMGDEILRKIDKGTQFTEANSVRVSRMDWPYVIKCKTSQCRMLGLLAKNGDASWSITRRGFAALRGDPFPATVIIWRNRIEERFDEQTTLAEAFERHRKTVGDALAKGKQPRSDSRDLMEGYEAADWIDMHNKYQRSLI